MTIDTDATAPRTTATVDGTSAVDRSYVAVVNVTLSASDATSGVELSYH